MTEISVILPARNAEATIGGTLSALACQDVGRPYEVVVVDNGSTDRTADIVERFGPPVRLVRREAGWPGAARNVGTAAAQGSVLAFTDADCQPTSSWLREGLRRLQDADLVQGAVRPDPTVSPGPFDRTLTVSGEGLYETANLFVRRSLFDELGGFDDAIRADIGRPFGEDVEFGWRARRSGARTGFAERALVYHAVFRRRPAEYVAERRRLGYFAALAASVPELRTVFFHRRVFLSKRTAVFDLAMIGGATSLVALSARALPAVIVGFGLGIPYAARLTREGLPWGRRGPIVLAVNLVADAVGAVSLLGGSLRWRSPVL